MLPPPLSGSVKRIHLRIKRGRIGLALVASLSVLAGMTDAIGFLASGDFVSFMSGNTTRLAVSVSNGEGSMVLRLALLLGMFIVGNALGVVLAKLGDKKAWPLLLCVASLLGAAALTPNVIGLIAAILAMGMLNAVVEEVNGLPIGLTYVTGALSRFGRGLGRWLLGENRGGWRVQIIPWAGMFVGAVIGALLEQQFGMRAMAASAALAVLIGLCTRVIPHQWQRGYMLREQRRKTR